MQNRILIEPIIDGKAHGQAVQAKTFQFSLKITNSSTDPSKAFTISKVSIKSAQGQDLIDDFGKKSFSVDVINPDESKIVNVGTNGQFMFGLIYISVGINTANTSDSLIFLQKNPFTGDVCEIGINSWADYFYIKNSSENLQEKTNRWLVILTCVIAISAVFTVLLPMYMRLFQ